MSEEKLPETIAVKTELTLEEYLALVASGGDVDELMIFSKDYSLLAVMDQQHLQ